MVAVNTINIMISTLKLIERQVAMSEIRTRLNEKVEPQPGRYVTAGGVAFGPCLLISRECGTGSTLLAEKIGEELGWNVFDSRIVDEIAKAAHVHQRLVQSVDERVHSYWEQSWRELLLEDLTDRGYLHHLGEVITALGHQGSVIIVGRGAQYLLPPECALRVRLVAPIESRICRIAGLEKLSPEEARMKIKMADSKRASFVWKVFKKDIGAPLNHDLVINTGELGLENAARIVRVALHEKLGVYATRQPDYPKMHAQIAA
jgi:cytidylate kinase